MNIWHDIDEKRINENEFIACIEITKNTKTKYELDKETGRLILDRVLYTSTHYPENYGFIPLTYSDDFDPLDVLVLCSEPLVPLSLVKCYPIGVIKMIDSDQIDEKIIAFATFDPSLNTYKDISELPLHKFEEISHFFKVYKELEGKKTIVTEICGKEEAKKIIKENIYKYKKVFSERKTNK